MKNDVDIDLLMDEEDVVPQVDSIEDTGVEPLVTIDLEEVDASAHDRANVITERLSNYYFDEKYINEHPYIPTKITMEMDNIRRLLKMLIVNEKAQDALIKAIALSPGKSTLFLSLTSMQKGTLLIQKQLNDLVSNVEDIFQHMQDDAEKQWAEKDKDQLEDGTITVRGSREFIKQLQKGYYKRSNKTLDKEKTNDDGTPEGATPISEII